MATALMMNVAIARCLYQAARAPQRKGQESRMGTMKSTLLGIFLDAEYYA
jgi:hypothetical protein